MVGCHPSTLRKHLTETQPSRAGGANGPIRSLVVLAANPNPGPHPPSARESTVAVMVPSLVPMSTTASHREPFPPMAAVPVRIAPGPS